MTRDAARDRAARDDHDVVAGRVALGDLGADVREHVVAQRAVLVRDDVRSELDDEAAHGSRRIGTVRLSRERVEPRGHGRPRGRARVTWSRCAARRLDELDRGARGPRRGRVVAALRRRPTVRSSAPWTSSAGNRERDLAPGIRQRIALAGRSRRRPAEQRVDQASGLGQAAALDRSATGACATTARGPQARRALRDARRPTAPRWPPALCPSSTTPLEVQPRDRRPSGSASIAAATSSNVAGHAAALAAAQRGGTRRSRPPSRGATRSRHDRPHQRLAVARRCHEPPCNSDRDRERPARRAGRAARSAPTVLGVAMLRAAAQRVERDSRARPAVRSRRDRARTRCPRSRRRRPARSPRASSARITPIRCSRRSTCASASSFSTSKRANSRSIGSPLTRNTPVLAALDATTRGPPRAGTRGARRARSSAASSSRRRRRLAPGPCAAAASASSSSPARVALEVTSTGTSSPSALAPRAPPPRPPPPAARGRPSTARARAAARASRASCAASSRSIDRVVRDRVRAVERREVERRARAAACARRARGSRGRGPAPSLAPSISPGMSARTSWRSPSSSTPSTGSSVVNG